MTSKRTVIRPQTADGQKYLKMKDLVQATQTPASTIQHYVEQGLLPKPVKTSQNMAYYPPDFIDRVETIRELKSKHKFPLEIIKKLMREKEMGFDLEPLIEMREILFSPSKLKKYPESKFLKATGLTGGELDACLKAGLLIPVGDSGFNSEDVAAGVVLHSFLKKGISLADLLFYPTMLDQVVSREMSIREQLTETLSYEKDAAVTSELTANSRSMTTYLHNRLLQKRALGRKGLKDRSGKE